MKLTECARITASYDREGHDEIRFVDFYGSFIVKHKDWAALDTEAAMAIAQLFCNFYTCAETIFFRISSFFEKNLDKERWHSHLLERMTCDIPGERPGVIRDDTALLLREFLKFKGLDPNLANPCLRTNNKRGGNVDE